MTSTSFNVGLGDGSRLSSRVLRPPGGGHTDIFGGDPEPPRGRRLLPNAAAAANASHIGEPAPATGNGEPAAPEPAPERKAEAPAKPDSPQEAKPAPAPVAEDKAEAPKRVRVPPGGFSSGLW